MGGARDSHSALAPARLKNAKKKITPVLQADLRDTLNLEASCIN